MRPYPWFQDFTWRDCPQCGHSVLVGEDIPELRPDVTHWEYEQWKKRKEAEG